MQKCPKYCANSYSIRINVKEKEFAAGPTVNTLSIKAIKVNLGIMPSPYFKCEKNYKKKQMIQYQRIREPRKGHANFINPLV